MSFLARLRKPNNLRPADHIIIVSGLPRSGTSMMMKMLEAGGIPILTDHHRSPDENNPKGYYEFERVKKLRDGDIAWLDMARGKAVKVISALLEYLPTTYSYKIVFLRRNIDEILASQRQMLLRLGEKPDHSSDEHMAELFRKHLEQVEVWLKQQSSMDILLVSYNDILADPGIHLDQIRQFLETDLNISPMLRVVDKNLYRERSTST